MHNHSYFCLNVKKLYPKHQFRSHIYYKSTYISFFIYFTFISNLFEIMLLSDFQKVQTDLTKKQPPGKTLTIEPVPTTSAVLVRNLPQNPPPSKDTIVNFFENERKTGGGEVTDVTFGENDEYAIVTFANIKGE